MNFILYINQKKKRIDQVLFIIKKIYKKQCKLCFRNELKMTMNFAHLSFTLKILKLKNSSVWLQSYNFLFMIYISTNTKKRGGDHGGNFGSQWKKNMILDYLCKTLTTCWLFNLEQRLGMKISSCAQNKNKSPH